MEAMVGTCSFRAHDDYPRPQDPDGTWLVLEGARTYVCVDREQEFHFWIHGEVSSSHRDRMTRCRMQTVTTGSCTCYLVTQ